MLNQETAKAARTDSGYILRAPRRMLVADAVAQYMRVPMGAGNSVPWDPLVAPYVIEPMNCLASREYDAVIFVGPARTGKTIGLIDGWVIYNVICDPADMLIIQMTEEKAREHSKKRLARTFRVSPEVVSRLSPNKNDNNVYDRTFLAGNYLKIGWPSVNIMSSSDYKCVALTDYDRFPEDIDGEGDAFSLASKRTTTFMSSGMTLVESSPGRDVKDVKWRRTSPHEAPPTRSITVAIAVAGTGPVHTVVSIFSPAAMWLPVSVILPIPCWQVRRLIFSVLPVQDGLCLNKNVS